MSSSVVPPSDSIVNVLVLGANGQVGQEIQSRQEQYPHHSFTFWGREQLDCTADAEEVARVIEEWHGHLEGRSCIINLAAYTAVDAAEEDKVTAAQVNASFPTAVAEVCRRVGVRLLHVSTDYVFPGTATTPIEETEPTSPASVYGLTKRDGEDGVIQALPDNSLIVRTSSVHGSKGTNFVGTMLKLFRKLETVSVVSDQVMSPTWAGWLADTLLRLVDSTQTGILHACSGAEISWYEFAVEILTQSRELGLLPQEKTVEVNPVTAAEFPRPAPRPAYSVMKVDSLTRALGESPLDWREGLRAHLKEIVAQEMSG